MKVYEALADAFAAEGTRAVFGLLGDGNMYWLLALSERHPGIRRFEVRHEGPGCSMADGWARVTGRPGVCTVTNGPGVTQLATALVVAARARTPLVVFAGDTPPGNDTYVQRFDERLFANGTETGFVRLDAPERAHYAVRTAFHLARTESRPVILSAPEDIQAMNWEPPSAYVSRRSRLEVEQRLAPDPRALAQAAAMIGASRKPVIIAGRGAVAADADEAILSVARRIGALVAATYLAKGRLAGKDDFYAGLSGHFASRAAIDCYREADLVIAVGASMNSYTLGDRTSFAGAKVVQIDRAPSVVMGNGSRADCYVQGDARTTLEQLDGLLAKEPRNTQGFRTPEVRAALARPIDDLRGYIELEPGTVDPRAASRLIDERLLPEAGVAVGNGHLTSFPAMLITRPRVPFLTTSQFGCIGQGLPTAIGATVATGKPIVLIDGDACAMMHLQELDTVVRYRLPVMIVVFNDEALGVEYHNLRARGIDPAISLVPTPDLAAIAAGFGCRGYKATTLEALGAAVDEFSANPGPMLVDLRISRSVSSAVRRRAAGDATA